MSKKFLELIKFSEQELRLIVNEVYFGRIKAIPNQNQTEYAIIYEQQISAISGPPINKETYLGPIKTLNDLERMAESYSKKIAQENDYFFINKANLSAKEAKIIKFKSKRLKEIEERFYSHADHLFPDSSKKNQNSDESA